MILNCEKEIKGAKIQLEDSTVYYITPGSHMAFAVFVLDTYRNDDMTVYTHAYFLRDRDDVDHCKRLYNNAYTDTHRIWNIVGNNKILQHEPFSCIQNTTYKIKKIRSVRDIERILDEIN